MAKHSHRTTVDRILFAITALFVLGGFIALGFLKNVSQENRALFVIIILVSSLGIVASLAGLLFVSTLWRRLRRWTWQRAITSWDRSSRAKSTPKYMLPANIAEHELRQLAIQIYSRMGYRVPKRDPEGIYLPLINPNHEIELVTCHHGSEPLALHHVYSLELEMRRLKAVRAFFWAPSGFTSECQGWAANRSIMLADSSEIGRFVDCAQAKGSRFLEY
ncbi:MAG TPA: restriction endonuclease [Anaerolineales bacterium]|nr:restriction endonuclease [Anaerolineales bacterium]